MTTPSSFTPMRAVAVSLMRVCGVPIAASLCLIPGGPCPGAPLAVEPSFYNGLLDAPMPLILTHLPPMHWSIAGAGIAAVTLALLFLANRRLGISSSLEDVCSLVIKWSYFRTGAVYVGRRWRLPFVAGLVIGGILSAALAGGWRLTWDAGMLDRLTGLGPFGKTAWMFVGGIFIGFGTRLAGGCTSGHGIFGLSNFEQASLVSTLSFMAGGIVTTQFVYRVLFHWQGVMR